MLKQLYLLLSGLIINPEKTWKTLAGKQELNNEDFYKSYLYPVIGIIALMSFCGIWIGTKDFQLQIALKIVIKETIAYFGGFYLAAYGLFRLSEKYFGLTADLQLFGRFSGYSSAAIYVVACINALFQSLFFLQIFILYTVYIVWHGSNIYIRVKENYLTKFTIFASAIIILSPVVIRMIMTLIMPGL
ncbi:MAG: hypothetical protein LBR97_01800 [Dysgonamonadaceae bacterium]|jgi:hypothetical protein|nr:hypothetical protein [Dysgonamonadaceae bacterium]